MNVAWVILFYILFSEIIFQNEYKMRNKNLFFIQLILIEKGYLGEKNFCIVCYLYI